MKMKFHIRMQQFAALLFILITGSSGSAQVGIPHDRLKVIGVADFDARISGVESRQVQQFLINELIGLNQYEVIDLYDAEYLAQKDTIQLKGCFSKECLQLAGRGLKADKMLTGSIMPLGEKVSISLRVLDVEGYVFEKNVVREYVNVPGKEFIMLHLAMNDLFGIANDEILLQKLTVPADFDNAINNPYASVLKADGPRSGIVGFTDGWADMLTRSVNKGGMGSRYPAMFQFGYQFEKQYINEGKFQGLFEIIPTVTGVDQGKFIPSLTMLNGLRNNKNGVEFAFGPVFSFARYSRGFFLDGDFYTSNDMKAIAEYKARNGGISPDYVEYLYQEGRVRFTTGFLLGVGKTFRSGHMNLPVNLFVIPGKDGFRFGVSVGWNSGKVKK